MSESISRAVPVEEIEVATQPLRLRVGIEPLAATLAPRPELSGNRYTLPGNASIYVIDPSGYRRHIPDPTTYNNLFRDWLEVREESFLNDIPVGPEITSGAVLAMAENDGIYIVSNGVKRQIAGPANFNRYYFGWEKVIQVPNVMLNFIPTGPIWN